MQYKNLYIIPLYKANKKKEGIHLNLILRKL